MASVRDSKRTSLKPRIEDLLDFGPDGADHEASEFNNRVEKLIKKLAELRARIDRLSEPAE